MDRPRDGAKLRVVLHATNNIPVNVKEAIERYVHSLLFLPSLSLTHVESFGKAVDFENVVAPDDHHGAI